MNNKFTWLLCVLLTILGFSMGATAATKVGANKIESWYSNVHKWVNANRPYFQYDEGCTAYTAVDKTGRYYSGGLKASGSPGGGCRTVRFMQTFTRLGWIGKKDQSRFGGAVAAIMYAQFFPKDQGNRHGRAAAKSYKIFGKRIGGHRYDWEEVVVFVNKQGNAIKASASYHGKYKRKWKNQAEAKYWHGNHIKIRYHAEGVKNNSFAFTTKLGNDPNRAQWSYLNSNYRKTVQDTVTYVDWKHATPKMINSQFWKKVKEAW